MFIVDTLVLVQACYALKAAYFLVLICKAASK